jgi:hypothetical protein
MAQSLALACNVLTVATEKLWSLDNAGSLAQPNHKFNSIQLTDEEEEKRKTHVKQK